MNKKQIEMIHLLSKQNQPMTSASLASTLQVSSRSVKNYVHEINGLYGKSIIVSSRNGYSLNPNTNISLLISKDEDELPQTNEERAYYIIKQLVLNHSSHFDLFDLADYLCIGYSTLKSLISKMNKMFSTYDVEFVCENDILCIVGSEYNKRKLISYVINEEARQSFINIDLLASNFVNIDVAALQAIILQVFKQHQYYLNDFALANLLLHLLIIIDRELSGNELDVGQSSFEIDTIQEKELLEHLIQRIEETFEIELNNYEKFEIYTLFKANANFSLETSNDDLKKVVGDSIIELTQEYVEKINNLYMIDLSSPAFTTPFALHLKNLIFRSSSGRYTNNPMAEAIRCNSPIVFDIAIFLSLDLMDRFNITINEDEAAFLAMHIGGEIERQTINKNKIPSILVCPDYHSMAATIINTLMLNFGNQINIICSVSDENDIDTIRQSNWIDIIFTTIPLKKSHSNMMTVSISPFNLSSQFEKIQTAIMDSSENFKDKKLKINFHNFLEEDLFFSTPKALKKNEVMDHLFSLLEEKEYVEDDFREKVRRREDAAHTTFGSVAIPHAVEMDAIKTSIAIGISKKGFQWENNNVHIVFLLAINKADKRTFRPLYEALISLCSDDAMIQEIRNCTTFSDFEHLIYSRIDMKDES